jgi:hypothetical protein
MAAEAQAMIAVAAAVNPPHIKPPPWGVLVWRPNIKPRGVYIWRFFFLQEGVGSDKGEINFRKKGRKEGR